MSRTLSIAAAMFTTALRRVFFSPSNRRYRDNTRLNHHPRIYNDVAQQLCNVRAASFKKRRLLSPSEYEVFKVVEHDVLRARRGFRVFAQTSLGEILQSPVEDAFYSINSKRVDILIVDQYGWPVLAVEYQGAGHYQGTAAARDAIKKEALRKAGVGYVEITENDTPAQIRFRVRDHLGWPTMEPGSPRLHTHRASPSVNATTRLEGTKANSHP